MKNTYYLLAIDVKPYDFKDSKGKQVVGVNYFYHVHDGNNVQVLKLKEEILSSEQMLKYASNMHQIEVDFKTVMSDGKLLLVPQSVKTV